jgi:hypothetical protein
MTVQPPEWARALYDAATVALVQASALRGGTFNVAEIGLLLQACENLDAASRILRAITDPADTPVHG